MTDIFFSKIIRVIQYFALFKKDFIPLLNIIQDIENQSHTKAKLIVLLNQRALPPVTVNATFYPDFNDDEKLPHFVDIGSLEILAESTHNNTLSTFCANFYINSYLYTEMKSNRSFDLQHMLDMYYKMFNVQD